jgi:flagellar biosynthesis/type III secretory pathway ATPase
LACDLCEPWHLEAVARVRGMLSALEDASDLIQLGAYVPGSDPRVDRARAALPALEALLRQGLGEAVGREQALRALREAAAGAP